MKPVAVIDLGTNTFHLLIAEVYQNSIKEVYRKRVFVNLAEDGIERISPKAFDRGIAAVVGFKRKLLDFDIERVKVFGTAALRTAANGTEFIQAIFRITGLNTEIIDGNREAELIFKGTSLIVPLENSVNLIMDIGGGSVELILSDFGKLSWKHSFKTGVTVLYNQFHKNDPIQNDEITKLKQFLTEEFQPLEMQLKSLSIAGLIGASGSFEVLQKMMSGKLYKSKPINYNLLKFHDIKHRFITSSLEERLHMPRLAVERAKLVVVAFILIDHVLEATKANHIIVSPYALKEGALSELIL